MTEARSLENDGDHTAAVHAYIRAGRAMDASRVLANMGHFGEAGDLLLQALKLSPSQVGTLTGARGSAALKAAVCYARAGRMDDASAIVLALGARESVVGTLLEVDDRSAAESLLRATARPDQPELTLASAARTRAHELVSAENHANALRLFRIAGNPVETAGALWSLGDEEGAVALLVDSECWLEAARCQIDSGDPRGAMASLSRIKPSSPHFRQACCSLIQMVHDSELSPSLLDESAILRLEDWDREAPLNLAELQALYLWARLLEDHGDTARAVALLARIRARRPGHADVTQRLHRLSSLGDDLPVIISMNMDSEPTVAPSPAATVAPSPAPSPAPSEEDDDRPDEEAVAPVGQTVSIEGLGWVEEEEVEASPEVLPSRDIASEGITPGMLVSGRYEIQQHLGDGGTAAVYKAYDTTLRECIAMKFFHLTLSRDEMMAERMTLELKLCRKLTHRNIIKIFDIGSFGGHRFLTMELLLGQTVEDLLESPIDMEQAIDVLTQACRGLHEAHSHNFVHRDVKPDNLFLAEDGTVKVMDFGIAKQTTAEGMTLTGTILGTPGYMAPEQIDGRAAISHAADQYAIGSLAYRMFTGSMVFEHEDMMPLLMMHVTERPELPSRRCPGLSPDIDTVVMRLLSKDPADRFPSCAKVADAFEAVSRAR